MQSESGSGGYKRAREVRVGEVWGRTREVRARAPSVDETPEMQEMVEEWALAAQAEVRTRAQPGRTRAPWADETPDEEMLEMAEEQGVGEWARALAKAQAEVRTWAQLATAGRARAEALVRQPENTGVGAGEVDDTILAAGGPVTSASVCAYICRSISRFGDQAYHRLYQTQISSQD